MKYLEKFRKRYSSEPVFTIRDAEVFLKDLGAGKQYIHLLISNLIKRGEIKRLRRGVYSFSDDPTLAGFAFSPSYHGLQDALSILDFWDQETNTVLITPLSLRTGLREILGGKVFVRKIDRSMFFGYKAVRYFDYWIQVSDVEKTLIDFVYFREPLHNAVLEEMRKQIDENKMEEYLGMCSEYLKKRVRSIYGR